jgi:hypothetical protein
LLKTLKGLYTPVLENVYPAAINSLEDLKAGIESHNKRRLIDENDLELEHIWDEFDFWQEQAISQPGGKSLFVNQVYTQVDKRWKSL